MFEIRQNKLIMSDKNLDRELINWICSWVISFRDFYDTWCRRRLWKGWM